MYKLLPPSPCPRLKKKTILRLDFERDRWLSGVGVPILGVPSCLRSARKTPGRRLALRRLGLVRAAARKAQVPQPAVAGEGAARRRPGLGGTMAAAAGAPGAPALGKGLA